VNNSGTSDVNDYNIIRTNFLGTGKTRAQGDLSGDGIVNFTDFRRWKLSQPSLGSATMASLEAALFGAVPEPGSLLLVLVGACPAIVVRRRRR
jgi:hypothetical protein